VPAAALEKFRLGLVDQRYVDVDAAAAVVGRADFVEAGLDAQRASYTLLTNNDDVLPLNAGLTVYVEGVDAAGSRLTSTPAPRILRRGSAPTAGFLQHRADGRLSLPGPSGHRARNRSGHGGAAVTYGSDARAFADVVFGLAWPQGAAAVRLAVLDAFGRGQPKRRAVRHCPTRCSGSATTRFRG
jgi:hypothetical protein